MVPGLEEQSASPASLIAAGFELYVSESPGHLSSRRSWVSRLTRANNSVSAVSAPVQRSGHRRGLAEIMRDPRFEPEAAGEGQMDEDALLVPRLIGRQTVRSESGDVEMERGVCLQVREARIWGLFVILRALPPRVDQR